MIPQVVPQVMPQGTTPDVAAQSESRFSSRKFLLAVMTILSATLLVCFKHVSDGVYSAVVIAVIGAYFSANVIQTSITPK